MCANTPRVPSRQSIAPSASVRACDSAHHVRGRPVAVVVGGEAVIAPWLRAWEHRLVAAMCLYAIDVTNGDRLGPYSDESAMAYARSVCARRDRRPWRC